MGDSRAPWVVQPWCRFGTGMQEQGRVLRREWPRTPRPRPGGWTAPGLLNGRSADVLHGTNAGLCSRLKADFSHPVGGTETGNILQGVQERGCGEEQGQALSINGEAGEVDGSRAFWAGEPIDRREGNENRPDWA